MPVTEAEFTTNPRKYLQIAETEDVLISHNGQVIAKLSNPRLDRISTAKSLFGILSDKFSLEESLTERLTKI